MPRPFGGMTVFENVLVAASQAAACAARRPTRAASRRSSSCGDAAASPTAAPRALGLLDRKRLELARALATDPAVLLLDEIGGGLTDAEAGELVAHDPRSCARGGIAIVWIEHIVHVLLQVVEPAGLHGRRLGHRRRRAGRGDDATPA